MEPKKLVSPSSSSSASVGSSDGDAAFEAPVVGKLSTLQEENQPPLPEGEADLQNHSPPGAKQEELVEKTDQQQKEQQDKDSSRPKSQQVTKDKNQTAQVRALKNKTGEHKSNSDSPSLQYNNAITLVDQSSMAHDHSVDESNKLTNLPETQKKKPPPFTQIFTKEDVIALLNGLIKFNSLPKEGRDMREYHKLAKDNLCQVFSKTQVVEKLRKLKRKFCQNLDEAGNVRSTIGFRNDHDLQIFKLSEKLWGTESCEKMCVEMNGAKSRKRSCEPSNFKKKKQIIMDEAKLPNASMYGQFLDVTIGGFVMPEMLKKNGMLIDSSNAQKYEAQWKKLQIEEAELHHKKLTLMADLAGHILKCLKD